MEQFPCYYWAQSCNIEECGIVQPPKLQVYMSVAW